MLLSSSERSFSKCRTCTGDSRRVETRAWKAARWGPVGAEERASCARAWRERQRYLRREREEEMRRRGRAGVLVAWTGGVVRGGEGWDGGGSGGLTVGLEGGVVG